MSPVDGWRSQFPAEWHPVPFWAVFRRSKSVGHPDAELLSVYRDFGVIRKRDRDDNFNRASEDLSTYQLVEPGDLVINKMKAWQGSLGVSSYRGIVSPAYFVYKQTAEASARFLNYAVRSPLYAGLFRAYSKGIRPGQWDLDPDMLRTVPLFLPPRAEQDSIADYLDRETAHIDALVATQERFVALLQERRAAAVGGVFQPHERTVPTRLRYLLAARPTYGVLVPRYVEGEDTVPFVRVGDLNNLSTEIAFPTIALSQSLEYSRTILRGGEVLLGVVGMMGKAAVAPGWLAGANVNRAVAVLHCGVPTQSELLCAWLGTEHFRAQAEAATSGDSVQATLGMDDLSGFEVHWPTDPDAATRSIIEATTRIDALIAKALEHIALALERRAALITEAVTGRVNVETTRRAS